MNKYLLILLVITTLSSCYKEEFILPGDDLSSWSSTTHSGSAQPDYDIVFDQEKVHRMDIVIDESDWEDMQSNLTSILGSSGTTGGQMGGPGGTTGGGMDNFSDETPIYVPCDVFYNGIQWYYVGIRYKGNSSLSSSYSSGIDKLPFRLEFNYFDKEYPNISDQTFYGFQQLSLSNNYDDESLMREKVATDLFREFGVPAPYSSFYELYIDYGDGPVYFGLYTLVEIVFDTTLEKQFGSNTGNCYKPEDDGASFSAYNFNVYDFEKKNNDESDWSDITAMYDALHSTTRTSDSEQWQSDLESVFDVDGFLKYLAVNSVIQNWDVYGNMPHNYYLYHDPSDDLLKWIPWDNNEAFQDGKMTTYNLAYDGISAIDWPLIPYILGQANYEQQYKNYISDFINGAFEPSKMQTQYNANKLLIESYVEAESSPYSFVNNSSEFESAVNALISHCSSRYSTALSYVNE